MTTNKRPQSLPYVGSPNRPESAWDNLSAAEAARPAMEARERRIAEQEAPGRRQYQANVRARRFAELAGAWRAHLNAAVAALDEMSVLAREAEQLRDEHGTIAVEAPPPRLIADHGAILERLRAFVAEVRSSAPGKR